MRKHIPNAITCLNLFCGCVGIVMAFQDKLLFASYAIIIAAVLDFFDGFLARLLNAYSNIGKELDSLADVVSFGVLPSVIVYHLFLKAPQIGMLSEYLNYCAFLIAMFSALRLAKFNVDTRQEENFLGLPTPANALLIASLPFIISGDNLFLRNYILNAFFLFTLSLGMSILLVWEIPLMSLKFKSFSFNQNLYRYILLIVAAVLILIFKFVAVPVIIFLYILLSIIQFRLIK
ncbi:MAG TPA: CDP-diacylglycerol--serine O-phosphatidyltransferase [Pedobacter sp.]